MYQVSRQQIVETAKSFLGYKFQHQARGENNSVDCVGLLVCIGEKLNYPNIIDRNDYRRIPKAEEIKEVLKANCDEISKDDVLHGDFYLMRLHSAKARHVAILIDENKILHASKNGVIIEDKNNYPENWFVAGFRLKGVA